MSKRKKLLRFFLVIVLIILGSAFSISRYFENFNFIKGKSQSLIFSLLYMQCFVLLSTFFLSLRLSCLSIKKKLPARLSFNAINLSLGLNLISIGRLSEFIKPIYIRQHADIPVKQGIVMVFFEKVSDLIFVAVLSLFCLTYITSESIYIFICLGIAFFAFLFFLPILRPVFFWAIDRIFPFKSVKLFLKDFLDHVINLRNHPKRRAIILLTLGGWGVSIFQYYFFVKYYGSIPLTLLQVICVFVFTTLGGVVAVLPASVGTYEAGFILGMKLFGYEFSEALILGIMMHISVIIFPIINTLWVFTTQKSGVSDLLKALKKAIKYKRVPPET